MGLFRKKQALEQNDPVFGRIVFEPVHGVDAWCHMPTGGRDHMVVIIAPSTGPSQAQRDFYVSLRDNLVSRESECKDFIASHEVAPMNLANLKIYSVEISPEDELKMGQFTIELSDEKEFEIHRVEYMNGQPHIYGIYD